MDLGTACSVHMDVAMRDLPCQRVQVDEIWAFVGAKARNISEEKAAQGWGDASTWAALDPDTKLVPTFRIGNRDLEEAITFKQDVAGRLRDRVQLTTDGHRPYITAVEKAFAGKVDYAQLIKIYGRTGDDRQPNRRYSPAICLGPDPHRITGKPDPAHISTSHVERQNQTMRMSMRRFTRLTNAFSKKVENPTAAVSLHFCHSNFCRVHQSLGVTPAMAARLSDYPWKIEELISLLEAAEATPIKRGRSVKTREARRAISD